MSNNFLLLAKKIAKDRLSPLLSGNSSDKSYRTLILDIKEKYLVLQNSVRFEEISAFTSSNLFTLDLGQYIAKAKIISGDGIHIFFPLFDIEIAQSDLVLHNNGKDSLECTFTNPFDGVTTLKKPVLAISETKVCIKGYRASKLFQENLLIPEVKIENKDSIIKIGQLQVKTKHQVVGLKGHLREEIWLEWLK